MKTKLFLTIITCFVVTSVFSQSNLNDYKYVIVPSQYSFLKSKDQYQLNSLTKFLFDKYGFKALMEGEDYPEDLAKNRCLALRSDVKKDNNLFKTKLTVMLKGCNDQILYTSKLGESREKDYKKAYNQALREAFSEFSAINYKYEPNENILAQANTTEAKTNNEVSQEIQKLKDEIQSLKKEKEKVAEVKKETTEVSHVKQEPLDEVKSIKEDVVSVVSNVLYAQEIENGFQLVDSSPKVVYKIKNTGLSNVFLVENKEAIIYKKDNDWILEYYSDNALKQDVLNIKF